MVTLLSFLLLYTSWVSRVQADYEMYDFENPLQPTVGISSSGIGSTQPTISPDRYKHGSHSLKWTWASDNRLEFDLSNKKVEKWDTSRGAIRFHMYNTNERSGKCLTLCTELHETLQSPLPNGCPTTISPITSCFRMSLNFEGWRAVWVNYEEFKGCSSSSANPQHIPNANCLNSRLSKIEKFSIISPSITATTSDVIYLDLLEFVQRSTHESRDSIVPPIKNFVNTRCFTCNQFSSITEQDALARYDQTNFWEQAYRWSVKSKMPTQLPSTVDNVKLTQIELIEKRLVNWYAKSNTAYFDLHRTPAASTYLKMRWQSLLNKPRKSCDDASGNIECAHQLFTNLNIDPTTKHGEPLFCRETAPNLGMKFEVVFHKILLPLALDYNIWSRIDFVSCELTKTYQCSGTINGRDLEAITSKNTDLDTIFGRSFGTGSIPANGPNSVLCPGEKEVCFNRFKNAIESVNIRRKEKIMLLFDYIRDQGFTNGCAMGSLKHQMLTGSGFMHAAFLMRRELENEGKLDYNIETMKWYSEFGEIYQTNFEYKGTTADRVRTTLLFRLLTVLAMPQRNEAEKKAKLRDMDRLKVWIDIAFTVNEGLLGLIKPDYLGFHHAIVYQGAYIPEALHTASLVSYLLDRTHYQLSDTSKSNIENALKLLRTMAVKYSTPPSVNGRYPDYDKANLGKDLPAYAYLAIVSPNQAACGELVPTSLNCKPSNAQMFLRLYDFPRTPSCPEGTNLCKGQIDKISYLNTLGAAELLEDIKSIAASSVPPITKEDSPNGNWAKNYAAMSIHRRNSWVVTVKGFNNYVFGPERYNNYKENLYGVFANHGTMLIANDEKSLSSKDIKSPDWNWSKIPGTTAIQLTRAEIEDVGGTGRIAMPQKLAGAATFQGSSSDASQRNGVFGMNFEQPDYQVDATHPFKKLFKFKKSVFFFNDYLVAIGSGISSTALKEIHTTLFQDKVTGATPSLSPPLPTSSSNMLVLRCNDAGLLDSTSFSSDVMLVDVNGNRYYVPNPTAQNLVVKEESSGYCRAWFNHGNNPTTTTKYNYLVDVNAEPVHGRLSVSVKPLITSSAVYTVLKDDTEAHVVQFYGTPDTYGYGLFQLGALLPGPVKRVTEECLMMAQETTDKLYLSISYPHLKLGKGTVPPVPNRSTFCADPVSTTTPPLAKAAEAGSTYFFCAESKPQSVHTTLSVVLDGSNPIDSITVDGVVVAPTDHDTYLRNIRVHKSYTDIQFYNLKKGFTTEVILNK